MLTPDQKQILEQACRRVFTQFHVLDHNACLHAALRLAIDAVDAIMELEQSLLDVGDEASCGLPDHPPIGATGTEVRCPNCQHSL